MLFGNCKTFAQCRLNAGQSYAALAQHWVELGCASRVAENGDAIYVHASQTYYNIDSIVYILINTVF